MRNGANDKRMWLPNHVLNGAFEYLFGETYLAIEHVRQFHSADYSLFLNYGGMLLAIVPKVIRRQLHCSQRSKTNDRSTASRKMRGLSLFCVIVTALT